MSVSKRPRSPEPQGDIPDSISPAWLRSFRERLRRWHQRHGRDLPWRGADAYRVWISEIMLQQTTVAAVVPYYKRFLAAFPTVTELASSKEERVLRLWEGLGYYSRARNLHKAAQVIVAEHQGRLPQKVESLRHLPGIGRYTAGAIASFAFDQPAPIVEANTLRLYSRLLNFDGDPRSTTGQSLLWAFAEVLLPRTRAGDFNQALTDLGATVCTPVEPRCQDCPVMTLCGAFQAGRQHELPQRARRPQFTDVTECAVVVRRRGKFLLRRCQPGERWAGLWDFPRFPVADQLAPKGRPPQCGSAVSPGLAADAVVGVRELTGKTVVITSWLGRLRHTVTRYRISLLCVASEAKSDRQRTETQELLWVGPAALSELPLSTTGREIVSLWITGR